MSAMNGRLWFGLSLKLPVFGSVISLVACMLYADARPAQADAAGSCAKLSDVEIVQLVNRWRTEFTSGSPEKLSALYADDATLIATKDGKPYKGKEAIGSYYKDLLAKHPLISIKPSSLKADCGAATVSGPVVYRITGERKGTRMLLGGRYTTEFGLRDGRWWIVRHSLAADPRSVGDPIDKGAAGQPPRP
jgi:uncharacterized protein (TIGR02246 family)